MKIASTFISSMSQCDMFSSLVNNLKKNVYITQNSFVQPVINQSNIISLKFRIIFLF